MNATLAAFHLVADFPGGAVALAPLMGKNAATLSHEVNPNYGSAKLGLEDAIKLSVLTEDLRIASAFAAQAGCMLLPLPKGERSGDAFKVLARMSREFSEMVAGVTEAVADGRTSSNELGEVEREAGELVAAIQATVQHVASLFQEREGARAYRPAVLGDQKQASVRAVGNAA